MMFWRRGPEDKFDVASDVELINRLVEGNRAAFPAFYSRYSKLIYRTIQNVERDLVEDIFQEFFARLHDTQFRALQLWNRSRPLSGFLRQVVHNFALDKLRKERPHRNQRGSDVLEELQVESEEVSAQETIEMREMRKGAIRAWAQLPSVRDRRLICGKYHRDTPPGVAAEREHLSPGTFRKALFDAQRRYMVLIKVSIPEYFS
jgi:RNA polymerase sigma factor (sigma-70 family)